MTSKSVFISYSHRDLDRTWLDAFAAALKERNLHIWLDEWNVKPGDRIADAVEAALRRSDAIVAVISGEAFRNPNVYFEIGVALGAGKRLILVVDPAAATEMPPDLRQRMWVALRDPDETAAVVANAVQASSTDL
jgi:nucleoside 2-deoxyribosyltransferase